MLMVTGQSHHSAKPAYTLGQLQSIARDAMSILLGPELTPLGKIPRHVGPPGQRQPLIKSSLQTDQALHTELSSLVKYSSVRSYVQAFKGLTDKIVTEPLTGGDERHKFLQGLKPDLCIVCTTDPSRQIQIWRGPDFETLVQFALVMQQSLKSAHLLQSKLPS